MGKHSIFKNTLVEVKSDLSTIISGPQLEYTLQKMGMESQTNTEEIMIGAMK